MKELLELLLSVYPIVIAIGGIIFFLDLIGIDHAKHLKQFFKTEEKPPKNKEELNKIRAEINKTKTKKN